MSDTLNEVQGAEISEDGVFRYALWRTWDAETHPLVFIGLNPSTADASADDPTIRRCRGFAKREGYGGLVMLNLFALRSTDPTGLRRVPDAVGQWNDDALVTRTEGRDIVAAWGATLADFVAPRAREVISMLRDRGRVLRCLGTTRFNHPRHPLYVAANAPLGWFAPSPHTVVAATTPDARDGAK